MTPGWESVEDGPRIERDRFGRPMIIPPDGGKPIAYTRCTTYVGALEDTYNLGRWQQRMVAHGLSARPDLLLRVSSLGPEPEKLVVGPHGTYVSNPRHSPWKSEMDEACDLAQEAAKAHAKATVGTALHAIAERMDRAEDVGIVPVDYLPHLAAYAEATAGWKWLHIERFCVLDELRIGGTPDRVVYVPGYDRPMIADLKTGDVTYGQQKMAMQLAVYARSEIYDLDGTRTPMPNGIDLDRGLIIALDATTGDCEVHEIDIAAGWDAVLLAGQVRRWRARRGIMRPAPKTAGGSDQGSRSRTNGRDRVPTLTSVADALRSAHSVAELAEIWRTHRDNWTPTLNDLAADRKRELTA